VQALIFVIDSTDRDAISMSSEYLDIMMRSPALRKAHVLVFANKQDLPGAQSADNIAESLMLKGDNDRRCHVQGSCGLSGDGILDGLRWIFMTMQERELRANNATNGVGQTE
jgi:signal recognition particle receptor subunit beta